MNVIALFPLIGPALLGLPALEESSLNEWPLTPSAGEEIAVMETSEGQIVLMFYPETAPNHVANFKSLAKRKFYDGTRFHRTIPNFMIQGGDPQTKDLSKAQRWGTGGNTDERGREITVNAEFSELPHERGVLSMARSQNPNSGSSQFFIMHQAASHLDGQYSVFGRVISGIEVVDKIVEKPSGSNGTVSPDQAVILYSVRIVAWEQEEKGKKKQWSINGWGGQS